jgi:hypothetical protein
MQNDYLAVEKAEGRIPLQDLGVYEGVQLKRFLKKYDWITLEELSK